MISRFLYVIFFVVVGILILFVGIGISVPGWDASVESPEVISPNPLKISPTIEEPTVIQEPIGAIIQGRIPSRGEVTGGQLAEPASVEWAGSFRACIRKRYRHW